MGWFPFITLSEKITRAVRNGMTDEKTLKRRAFSHAKRIAERHNHDGYWEYLRTEKGAREVKEKEERLRKNINLSIRCLKREHRDPGEPPLSSLEEVHKRMRQKIKIRNTEART